MIIFPLNRDIIMIIEVKIFRLKPPQETVSLLGGFFLGSGIFKLVNMIKFFHPIFQIIASRRIGKNENNFDCQSERWLWQNDHRN